MPHTPKCDPPQGLGGRLPSTPLVTQGSLLSFKAQSQYFRKYGNSRGGGARAVNGASRIPRFSGRHARSRTPRVIWPQGNAVDSFAPRDLARAALRGAPPVWINNDLYPVPRESRGPPGRVRLMRTPSYPRASEPRLEALRCAWSKISPLLRLLSGAAFYNPG